MSTKNNKAIFGILILILFFFLILMGFSIYTLNAFKDSEDSSLSFTPKGDEIAVIEVNGVIIDSREVVDKLRMAEKSKKIKNYYNKYNLWWLVLVDQISNGFNDNSKSYIKSMVSVNSCWDKVIVLHNNGSKILEF